MAANLIDGYRDMIDDMENLSRDPHARPEDVAEARERLANFLGPVRMLPENGRLVAEVGLQLLELEPASSIRVVAGVGFEPTTFGL